MGRVHSVTSLRAQRIILIIVLSELLVGWYAWVLLSARLV